MANVKELVHTLTFKENIALIFGRGRVVHSCGRPPGHSQGPRHGRPQWRSDRVYGLEAGSVICEGTPADVRDNPRVIASYLGTDERAINRSGGPPPGALGSPQVGLAATTDAGTA